MVPNSAVVSRAAEFPWDAMEQLEFDGAMMRRFDEQHASRRIHENKSANRSCGAAVQRGSQGDDDMNDMDGNKLKVGDFVGFKSGHEQNGKITAMDGFGQVTIAVWNSDTGGTDTIYRSGKNVWLEA